MTLSSEYLISSAELASLLDDRVPPVVLDARFSPVRGALVGEYRESHIPGARFIDLPRQVFPAVEGWYRPENRERAEALLSGALLSWGVGFDDDVVVYGGRNGISGAYAWWTLRWSGHRSVRFLNGGFDAWAAESRPTEAGTVSRGGGGGFRPTAPALPVVSAEEIVAFAEKGQLVDARAASKFLGESGQDDEPTHIPGAVNIPTAQLLSGGLIADADTIRAVFDAAGVDLDRPIALYCGAGIASAFEVLLLTAIGVDARFFPGGWSAWTTDSR